MAKQTLDEKARSYLADGKVKAKHVDVDTKWALFHVTGSDPTSDPYFVKYGGGLWKCDCPAHVPECAHVKACMLVTDFQNSEKPDAPSWAHNPDIDALLKDL